MFKREADAQIESSSRWRFLHDAFIVSLSWDSCSIKRRLALVEPPASAGHVAPFRIGVSAFWPTAADLARTGLPAAEPNGAVDREDAEFMPSS